LALSGIACPAWSSADAPGNCRVSRFHHLYGNNPCMANVESKTPLIRNSRMSGAGFLKGTSGFSHLHGRAAAGDALPLAARRFHPGIDPAFMSVNGLGAAGAFASP